MKPFCSEEQVGPQPSMCV